MKSSQRSFAFWVWSLGPLTSGCTLDVYSEPAVDAGRVGATRDTSSGADASAGDSCRDGQCEGSCNDGVRNDGETGVDCGGPCGPCSPEPSCSDDQQNQDETGVDCGGVCEPCSAPATCSDGKRNQDETGVDCGGVCEACPVTETCSDDIKNQDETGIDCGGVCEACPVTETCSDAVQNQDEEDVDCGGVCEACPPAPTCSDEIENQDEEGVDCGGVCTPCETCGDAIQNQDEEGVDCGGACRACPLPGSIKYVGNITQGGNLRSDFGQWNQLTPENEGKWRSLEPIRDEMNWDRMDQYYQYTRSRGIPLKAHTFCWGSQQPDWIGELSEQEQRDEVEEYIRSYCERYPAVEWIDAVNEPDHAPPVYRNALGGAGETGHDWIIQCFRWARQYCPNATLILNDYNVLRGYTDQYVAIAKKVKAAGLLDAVADQAHGLETISMAELELNMQKLAALELPIFISEYDVDLADDAEQLAVYRKQFPFFYNHPQVVAITLWGYVQGQTWRDNTYLLRSDDSKRPAFDWISENYMLAGVACGDATCDANEDCHGCSLDCGSCEDACSDGELSHGETDIDCGGPCDACPEPVDAGVSP